jgi:hypothetical protein
MRGRLEAMWDQSPWKVIGATAVVVVVAVAAVGAVLVGHDQTSNYRTVFDDLGLDVGPEASATCQAAARDVQALSTSPTATLPADAQQPTGTQLDSTQLDSTQPNAWKVHSQQLEQAIAQATTACKQK